jgi:hypothetical protein
MQRREFGSVTGDTPAVAEVPASDVCSCPVRFCWKHSYEIPDETCWWARERKWKERISMSASPTSLLTLSRNVDESVACNKVDVSPCGYICALLKDDMHVFVNLTHPRIV